MQGTCKGHARDMQGTCKGHAKDAPLEHMVLRMQTEVFGDQRLLAGPLVGNDARDDAPREKECMSA